MSEHTDLLDSIAKTIDTFRSGELPAPTRKHVDRWARQFTSVDQMDFLRAFNFTIDASYIDIKVMQDFLSEIAFKTSIVGANPRAYWLNCNFLKNQMHGESQSALLEIFDQVLQTKLGISLHQCGTPQGDHIYFDDVIFTGNRARTDLTEWISKNSPQETTLRIISLLTHTGADWYLMQQLAKAVDSAKKQIQLKLHSEVQMENRKSERLHADVMWPTALPNDQDTRAYESTLQYRFEPRQLGGKSSFFEAEPARTVLESAFLSAGMHIRSLAANPSPSLKPLGFGGFGLGFGSTLVTYRNCPNNCPLALWWGNPLHTSGPLQWYPLLSRKI